MDDLNFLLAREFQHLQQPFFGLAVAASLATAAVAYLLKALLR